MRNKLNKTTSDKPAALPAQAQVALNNAIALHQHGNIDAAQTVYESILKSHPKNFDALHLLNRPTHSCLSDIKQIFQRVISKSSHSGNKLPLFSY